MIIGFQGDTEETGLVRWLWGLESGFQGILGLTKLLFHFLKNPSRMKKNHVPYRGNIRDD